MLDIQKAIKKVIERFIVNLTPLTATVLTGGTSLPVASSRRYCLTDEIVVFSKLAPEIQAEGEVHTIAEIPDNRTIIINEPLVADYPLGISSVEKLTGNAFLEAVYLGDPPIIPMFPAITVNAKSRKSEWYTLESTFEEFDLEITVYVTAVDYESQYELMHKYTKAIENSLFRTFYPLVEPFASTTLAEDVAATDNIIKIVDQDMLSCRKGDIFIEDFDYTRINRAIEDLGNGVYQLAFPVGRDFQAGDSVIFPLRHIFKTHAYATQYGTINKGTMLKAAVISWRATEEVRRFTPHIDPLVIN